MFRTVLQLPQTFILGVKLLVYKADDTLFIAPKLKTPGTICVLHHILGNDENFNWTVLCFFFGSTMTKILANVLCNVSKLLVLLTGAGLSNSCLTNSN